MVCAAISHPADTVLPAPHAASSYTCLALNGMRTCAGAFSAGVLLAETNYRTQVRPLPPVMKKQLKPLP